VDPSAFCDIRWVHVFEEDTPTGAVYRPDTAPVPLSRRPREAFTLHADGSAVVESGGPDDRSVDHPARWEQVGQELVITPGGRGSAGGAALHIVKWSPDRVVVAPSA
jgi:hypothetical protein